MTLALLASTLLFAPLSLVTGTVQGTVWADDIPAGYANVIVVGTRLGAQSDEKGQYRIPRVPVGKQTLQVFLTGHSRLWQQVQVEGDSTTTRDLVFDSIARKHPKDRSYEIRVGPDCDEGGLRNRKRGTMRRTTSRNPAGTFALQVDIGDPWILEAIYWLKSAKTRLNVFIYNSDHETVRTFRIPAGRDSALLRWDGRDGQGVECPAGSYFVRFASEEGPVDIGFCVVLLPSRPLPIDD